jgi:hypothetical protein
MVFAVIGVGYKSDLLMAEESIDTDRYIQNLDRLGFISAGFSSRMVHRVTHHR